MKGAHPCPRLHQTTHDLYAHDLLPGSPVLSHMMMSMRCNLSCLPHLQFDLLIITSAQAPVFVPPGYPYTEQKPQTWWTLALHIGGASSRIQIAWAAVFKECIKNSGTNPGCPSMTRLETSADGNDTLMVFNLHSRTLIWWSWSQNLWLWSQRWLIWSRVTQFEDEAKDLGEIKNSVMLAAGGQVGRMSWNRLRTWGLYTQSQLISQGKCIWKGNWYSTSMGEGTAVRCKVHLVFKVWADLGTDYTKSTSPTACRNPVEFFSPLWSPLGGIRRSMWRCRPLQSLTQYELILHNTGFEDRKDDGVWQFAM